MSPIDRILRVTRPSRYRLHFQLAIHVAVALHLAAYYGLGWRKVGGLDVQAFFHDFVSSGTVSEGALLAGAAFLSTLAFGRVFCGWACHFGGWQDLSAWILRRFGWELVPIRTRFLHWMPFALLGWVFLWPAAESWSGQGSIAPSEGGGFALKASFGGPPWANLPGAAVTAATFLACGSGLLFFLGSRGFCRYVCPYGAVFRLFDRAAPYRVRKIAACGPCGDLPADSGVAPCTASCPMGVEVHEQSQRLGAVRDVDCIRCHICVEACPRGALEQAFSGAELPVISAPPASARWSFGFGSELAALIFAALAFGAWDLVYAAHFLAAALALGAGFLLLATIEAVRARRLLTPAGAVLPALVLLAIVGVAHAGSFKFLRARGDGAFETGGRAALLVAASSYERALALLPGDRRARFRYATALAALGDPRAVAVAEDMVRSAPDDNDARELAQRLKSALPTPSSNTAPVTPPPGGLDKNPPPR